MNRSVDELLTVLDNLSESWKTLGQPSQHQVQTEAVRELRTHLQARSSAQQKGKR